MNDLKRISDLTDAETFFIIDAYAKFKSAESSKKSFDDFFNKKIDGNLILEIAIKNKKQIEIFKKRYEGSFEDIPVANRRNRILMYQELFNEAKQPRIVAIGKDGEPIIKAEIETARKCLDSIGKEMAYLENKNQETNPNHTIQDNNSQPQLSIKVIHSDD